MKSWNLSNFDDLCPNVLSSVDKDSSVELPSRRKRRNGIPTSTVAEIVGTVVVIAAISWSSLQVHVCGSDDVLRLSSAPSVSNIQTDRPPLTLLFGAKHHLKWDAAKEAEMLERAAASVAAWDGRKNEVNLIHAVLHEDLPSDKADADDLAALGIKLG